jgi:O-antigen ligase
MELMIAIFLISLPFIAYSLAVISDKDFLFSYATAGSLIFYFFMHKKELKIYFPKEASLFLLYIAFLSVSLLFHSGIVAKSVSQLITTIMYFFFYLLLVNILALQEYKNIFRIVNGFIYVCVVVSVYSSLQAVFPANSILYDLFRNAGSAFYVWKPSEPIGISHVQWGGLNRVTGLGCEPSVWAAFLTVPLGLLIPRLLMKRKTRDLIMFSTIFLCLLLTYGRTGWLSFLFVTMLVPTFSLTGAKRKWFLLIALAAISLIFFSVMFFGFGVSGDWSRVERLAGLDNAWRMFLSSPLFGIGLGRYQSSLAGFAINWGGGSYGIMAYNWYLTVLAETGIFGFGLWLLFVLSFWGKIITLYNRLTDDRDVKALCVGVALALLSILFSWLNVNGINFMYIWFILALISALPIVIEREAAEPMPNEEK